MRVIVVGAGMGGLTLAQGLRQAGIDVVVYERDDYDGAEARPQGVSLHLDDRAITALQACLPPAHLAMAEATMGGLRDRTQVMAEVDGELAIVSAEPVNGTSGHARLGRAVDRRLLREVLLAEMGDAVHFGAGFDRFELLPDGTVQAWFSDGSTAIGDVLVGADGIGSAVRRQYLPEAQVMDTGMRMLMGATPLRALVDTGLPDIIGEYATSARIRETTMAMAAVRFAEPPAAARDRCLPSLRARIVEEIEDYVMWALPTTPEKVGSAQSAAEAWRCAVGLVADLHPTIRLVLDAAQPETAVALRIGMIPPVTPWAPTPVTLVGDAIHTVPGFGANMAMEDALRLRDALARVERGEEDLVAAIGGYEDALRRERAVAAAAFSASRGPAAGAARASR